jgi:hypothetical protein
MNNGCHPIHNQNGSNVIGALQVQWSPLEHGDTGKPYVAPHRADKTVQLSGTLGVGGTATIQGTNMQAFTADPTALSPTYATLNDAEGDPLAMTTAEIRTVLENTLAIRPSVVGDGSTAVTVTMLISSSARL